MHRKLKHLIILAALVAVSSFALAQEPPGRVGRISSAEGEVTVQSDGEEAGGSLLNWPVVSDSRITAARGARMEFRVGSAAVRLDGDSSIEVMELDDNSLRLRLDYGTASVRLRSAEQLEGFELLTPQARVTMTEPGWVRIDAERQPDTTVITVLSGAARVDGAGTALALRAGKRIEVRGDDISTGLAQRTAFDDWVLARDKRDENSRSLRYLTADVTGYEELDHYGTWREDPEYGPLWAPRVVPVGWAPYRDGRWTWLEPWGWTWVDDAPWGYAPSHYGRWVMVRQHWHWAPGRFDGRPVWAPALVGWVGGGGWSVTFSNRHAGPGLGWYPLTPRDRFVPNYRVSPDHARRLEWRHRGDVQWRDRDGRHDGRREGVTVLPREQFEARRTVNVGRAPRLTMAPGEVRNVPLTTAPLPTAPLPTGVRPGRVIETGRDRDDWRERRRDEVQRGSVLVHPQQPGRALQQGQPSGQQRPPVLQTAPLAAQPGQPVPQPGVAVQDERHGHRFERRNDDAERERRDRAERDRNERNERNERDRWNQQRQTAPMPMPQGQLAPQGAQQMHRQQQQAQPMAQPQPVSRSEPVPQQAPAARPEPRHERPDQRQEREPRQERQQQPRPEIRMEPRPEPRPQPQMQQAQPQPQQVRQAPPERPQVTPGGQANTPEARNQRQEQRENRGRKNQE